MSTDEKSGRLDELEERVAYLEDQVGERVEKELFKRDIERLFGESFTYTDRGSHIVAKTTEEDVELQEVIKKVEEQNEWGWNLWKEDETYILTVQNTVPII